MLFKQHLLGNGKLRYPNISVSWLKLFRFLELGPIQDFVEKTHEGAKILQHIVVLVLARFLNVVVKGWLDCEEPYDEANYLAVWVL